MLPLSSHAIVPAESFLSARKTSRAFATSSGLFLRSGELLTDEAGQFGVRLRKLALVGLGANLLRDPVVVLAEHALENGDFGRRAVGGDAEVDDPIFLAPRMDRF